MTADLPLAYNHCSCACHRTPGMVHAFACCGPDLCHQPPEPKPAPARKPVTFPIPADAPKSNCRSCGAAVAWITTAAGKRMPVDADGTSHFATCPQAAQHRRPR